jgi:hypothetical protein
MSSGDESDDEDLEHYDSSDDDFSDEGMLNFTFSYRMNIGLQGATLPEMPRKTVVWRFQRYTRHYLTRHKLRWAEKPFVLVKVRQSRYSIIWDSHV